MSYMQKSINQSYVQRLGTPQLYNKPRGIHIKKLIYLFADKTVCYVLKNNEFTGSKPVNIDAVFNTPKNTDDINIFKK